MFECKTGRLRIVCDPRGGSLAAIQLFGADGWFDLAQNNLVGDQANRRPGLINMYEYAGRLAPDGSFPFDISSGTLTNTAERFHVSPETNWHPMKLHGPANQNIFELVSTNGRSNCQMRFDSRGKEGFLYPSDLVANTTYSISDATLEVSVEIENVGKFPMPIGGGSHGLFAKYPAGTMTGPELMFTASQMMNRNPKYPDEAMPDGNPIATPAEHCFTSPRVPEDIYDTVFMGWDGKFNAHWKSLGLTLEVQDISTTPTTFLHLWYDKGRGTWAPEPVIAPGNAFNLEAETGRSFGVRILLPGDKSSFRHRYTWTLAN